MSKEIILKANLELGVVPTHVKFVGGLVPDENGKLPRNADGEFVVVAEMKKLMEQSPVAITSVQVPYFGGADAEDVDAFYNGLKDLGLTLHIIMMVGGADPMSPEGEDAVVAQLVEGLQTAKKFGVATVSSTSLEEWMDPNASRKDGAEFDAAVKQVIKLHVRAYEEAGVAGSCVEAWNLEFLRGIEFSTFTDLGRVWEVAKGANEVIGKKFFKLLIDAAHCGDSELSIDENAALIAKIAESGEMGMFHASSPTTRGCLSTDDGWIGALLTACAKTGKLTQVFVELFNHEDDALAGLRAGVEGHGVDTTDGRTYSEAVIDGLRDVSRRINNLVARGLLK
ncbi:hypothetical protein Rhal01_00987 [Rubritalea halochordaticola]|uniref:Sugar phosphate isomerase/epimerase n=1 Tax=Rubritalea halochordaticola TaxID=714537 RepID=A0ABP9UWJ2_9BACT